MTVYQIIGLIAIIIAFSGIVYAMKTSLLQEQK